MIVVVATIQSIQYYAQDSGDYLYYIAFNEQNESNGARFGGAIVNALIIIAVIIVMTCVLVLLVPIEFDNCFHLIRVLPSVFFSFLFSLRCTVQVSVLSSNLAVALRVDRHAAIPLLIRVPTECV